MKRVIYIAGAYRAQTEWGITQNIRKAEKRALELWRNGFAVICPHKNTQGWNGSMDDRVFLDGCLDILKKCDCIFMLDNWKTSKGSVEEHELAVQIGIPIYYEEEER